MSDKDEILSEKRTDYLTKAIRDYHLFATQIAPLDAKEFTAHHNACKAALAHILMIQKLIQPKENTNYKAYADILFSYFKGMKKEKEDS